MPTNPVSLLVYVGLLLPGFAFAAARSSYRPIEVRSAFFESAAAVLVSILCDIVVLTVGIVAGLLLRLGPQVEAMLRDPSAAYTAQPLGVLLGVIGLLVVSTVLGLLLGSRRSNELFRRVVRVQGESHGSTWHDVFEVRKPEGTVAILVEIEFTDGSGLQGVLSTFDRLGTDSGDRGLVLSGGIARRPSDQTTFTEVVGFPTVAVTDRNIRSLEVTYLDGPWPPPDEADPEPDGGG